MVDHRQEVKGLSLSSFNLMASKTPASQPGWHVHMQQDSVALAALSWANACGLYGLV
jgi:hypothetical protein